MHAQCMMSKDNVNLLPCDGVFVIIFFKKVYKKPIIRFSFAISKIKFPVTVISLGLRLGWWHLTLTLIILDVPQESVCQNNIFCWLALGLAGDVWIGHLWVFPSVCFKVRLYVKLLIWRWFFNLMLKNSFSQERFCT